ncbi:MAG: hypothetical protein ACLSGB_16315 [Dorea sp.]
MNKFLNNTRGTENEIPVSRKIRNTILILCLGIVLGTFSKFLDNTASNALPFIFEYLDVRNFLGRFAVWLLIALCIAIYSRSSLRASLNVFVFFVGMVSSYYIYSNYVVRLSSEKLCNDLGWLYSYFSILSILFVGTLREKAKYLLCFR